MTYREKVYLTFKNANSFQAKSNLVSSCLEKILNKWLLNFYAET